MGRPNQCNPCCGGNEPPPPPPPEDPFENYYCSSLLDCDSGFLDDYVIAFQRINSNQPVTFSYNYFDFANYTGEDPEYYYDGCTFCVKGSNLITSASCSIPPNNTNKNICTNIYHNYCDQYEFIIIEDGFMPANFIINNANIINTKNGYWSNCCDYLGYYGNWSIVRDYGACACINVIVPPDSEVVLEYYDCFIEQKIGFSIVNTNPIYPSANHLCITPNSWNALINSIRNVWKNICNAPHSFGWQFWNTCYSSSEWYNDISDDIFSIFGDKITIISGNPSFIYKGICKFDESAPQCLKDLVKPCGE